MTSPEKLTHKMIISALSSNGNKESTPFNTFDERKNIPGSDIEKIAIETTFAEIHVFADDCSDIEVHFYGIADLGEEIMFNVEQINELLNISLKTTETCSNVDLYPIDTLYLDIRIPSKMFHTIAVTAEAANIIFDYNVLTHFLVVQTKSGYVDSNATVNHIQISTTSADINFGTDATQDIFMEMRTITGDVSVVLHNINDLRILVHSVSGNIKNCHKNSNGYTARGRIATTNGNIRIGYC